MTSVSVCAVTFSPRGRLHYVDPGALVVRVGDRVLVPTEDGPALAVIAWGPGRVDPPMADLPRLSGVAGPRDIARHEAALERIAAAWPVVRRSVREHALPMKVVGIDFVDRPESGGISVRSSSVRSRPEGIAAHPGPRFTVFFAAPTRVDFRLLLRDLSRELGARLELRQVSARDEAKVVGGLGLCGQELCCAGFLADFVPVSVRMAKEQDLVLSPARIAGGCCRLMCCLAYENPSYVDFRAAAPPLGSSVDTPDGPGRVTAYDVPRDRVVVRLDETGARCACPRSSVCPADRPGGDAVIAVRHTEDETSAWSDDDEFDGGVG